VGSDGAVVVVVGRVLPVVPSGVVVSVGVPDTVDSSVGVGCSTVVSGVVVVAGAGAGALVDAGAWSTVPVVAVPVVSGRMFR
jgi:hypothetical protein